MPSREPSLESAGVDHLQEIGSQTEETGNTGTRYLVGGTLEDGSGGRWCNDGSNGGADGNDRRWGCNAGLAGLRGWGEGRGDWHNGADGEGTLGHGEGLAWGGRVGCDRG